MIAALVLSIATTCVPVEGDRILARDLAGVEPTFASWQPETELGFSPAPGLRRVLRGAELTRLAARQGIAAGPLADVCVERPTVLLTAEDLRNALIGVLGNEGTEIEILDWSRYPIPRGAFEFPRNTAAPEGAGLHAPVRWKGFVHFGASGRFSVWVRARIHVRTLQVCARKDLAAGKTITPDQIEVSLASLSPFGPQPARSVLEVAGSMPRRTIAAGSLILPSELEAPLEVHSGDPVTVRASSGPACVKLEAIAAGSGRRGDIIPVKNPSTGRAFRARVEGTGQVSVAVPGAAFTPSGGAIQ